MGGSKIFKVTQPTALRGAPAHDAEILRLLDVAEIVAFAGEKQGEWIKVSVALRCTDPVTGWILVRCCAETAGEAAQLPLPLTIAELSAKRRAASAVPVGHQAGSAEDTSAYESLPYEPDDPEDPVDPQKPNDIDFEVLRGERDEFSHKSLMDSVDFDIGPSRPGERRTRERVTDSSDRAVRHAGTARKAGTAKRAQPKPSRERASAPEPKPDVVDISVFGPETLRAGGVGLIQIFLHLLAQSAEAEKRAKATDPNAGQRAVNTLLTEIAHGQRVRVIFDGDGLSVDETTQQLVWRGEPATCQFRVRAPAGAEEKTYYPRIQVLLDSAPIGSVAFALRATVEGHPAVEPVIRGEQARRYSYAFLSYASDNRAEVLKRAQGLKAARIDFFQDLLSLDPGDRWEKKLYSEIDRCDLFLLFWSTKAKESPWVLKEALYALARQKASAGRLPDITPVIIEGPPAPLPSEDFKDIHFNDSLAYVLAGVQAEAKARK